LSFFALKIAPNLGISKIAMSFNPSEKDFMVGDPFAEGCLTYGSQRLIRNYNRVTVGEYADQTFAAKGCLPDYLLNCNYILFWRKFRKRRRLIAKLQDSFATP
jgi:hypothetical protein